MPRDSGGNYTLPAGNPVSPGTIIESNWANTTLEDVRDSLTDSLDRNGRGAMQAALRGVDGSLTTPGFAFSQEVNTGLARIGSNLVLVRNGVAELTLAQGAATFAGSVSTPSGPLVIDGPASDNTRYVRLNRTWVPEAIPNDAPSDGSLYGRLDGTWSQLPSSASIIISPTPPSSPSPGLLWYESDTGREHIYFDDGDSQQWVEMGPGAVAGSSVLVHDVDMAGLTEYIFPLDAGYDYSIEFVEALPATDIAVVNVDLSTVGIAGPWDAAFDSVFYGTNGTSPSAGTESSVRAWMLSAITAVTVYKGHGWCLIRDAEVATERTKMICRGASGREPSARQSYNNDFWATAAAAHLAVRVTADTGATWTTGRLNVRRIKRSF